MQMAGWGLAHVAIICYYIWFLRGTQPGALGHSRRERSPFKCWLLRTSPTPPSQLKPDGLTMHSAFARGFLEPPGLHSRPGLPQVQRAERAVPSAGSLSLFHPDTSVQADREVLKYLMTSMACQPAHLNGHWHSTGLA